MVQCNPNSIRLDCGPFVLVVPDFKIIFRRGLPAELQHPTTIYLVMHVSLSFCLCTDLTFSFPEISQPAIICAFFLPFHFSDLRPTSLEKSQEVCRLRIYEVYAWGVPLVIAGVAAILDNMPDTVYLRPRFGEQTCWFYGELFLVCEFGMDCSKRMSIFASYLG